MPSEREQFFQVKSFVVVGNSAGRPFPKLTYGNLKKAGKKVFPVDLAGAPEVQGDPALRSVDALPEPVEAAVVAVAREQTLEAVRAVLDAGIRNVWLHMGTDTPEALALCRERGANVQHGTCAVMYTQQGASFHSIHKWIMKLKGKY